MGLPNNRPFEIMGAPYTLWVAPPATEMPEIDDDTLADWAMVGSYGPLNYDAQAGVTLAHPQGMEFFRSLGDAGSRKVFRSTEDLQIRVSLADVSLEQYRYAINNATLSQDTTVGGKTFKQIGLSRGLGVATMALLVRGPSPYMDDGISQFWVPVAVQTGSPEANFVRTTAALLPLEWTALVDQDAENPSEAFGILAAETPELDPELT